MDFDVFELVKTVEFSVPIGGEDLTFRLECLQDMERKNCFRFRVGRLDGCRLVPSFPVSEDDTIADERFFVEDLFWVDEGKILEAPSADDAIRIALSRIREKLGLHNQRAVPFGKPACIEKNP
jgi:hypothetical protein